MDEALNKAVGVFSERGYHGTSIDDLIAGMEMASGSIYKAFRDKRAVFVAAFDRYKTVRDEKLREAISKGTTGREKIRNALVFYGEASQGAEGRQGCLVTGCATELATFDEEISQRIAVALDKNEQMMSDLILQGQSDGSIPAHVDSKATARLMLCLVHGMRLIGKTGRTRAQMAALVDIAMKTLD
jgi:TetR/AcrR family transcriptional regulator, transcriptional repressor for nem operon